MNTRTVTFAMTRADIAAKGNPSCPIDLAIQRRLPRLRPSSLTVGWDDVYIHSDRYPMSRAMRRFVERFDAGETVRPIRFSLSLPDRVARLTSHRRGVTP